MRILFSSHVFAPSVGGIETVSRMLAGEFVRQGHEVVLITQTAGEPGDGEGYRIHRRPSAQKLLCLMRWCDVYFHNNISLRAAWPLLFVRRPWVVAHHVWIPKSGLAARIKRWLIRRATCISVSRAIAEHLDLPSKVIPNPYDNALFRVIADLPRDRDLVFVGRLVSDKGVNLLISALATLSGRGLTPRLTVIGSGPEAEALQHQARSLGMAEQVTFAGMQRGEDLVRLLNRHCVMVVPSVWLEPFGLVALEGVASGCVAVVSTGGGLSDAMGPCGATFPSGDSLALADVLQQLLADEGRRREMLAKAPAHLAEHHLPNVAARYLAVLGAAAEKDHV